MDQVRSAEMMNWLYATGEGSRGGAMPQPVRPPSAGDGVGRALRKAFDTEVPSDLSEWDLLLANIR